VAERLFGGVIRNAGGRHTRSRRGRRASILCELRKVLAWTDAPRRERRNVGGSGKKEVRPGGPKRGTDENICLAEKTSIGSRRVGGGNPRQLTEEYEHGEGERGEET